MNVKQLSNLNNYKSEITLKDICVMTRTDFKYIANTEKMNVQKKIEIIEALKNKEGKEKIQQIQNEARSFIEESKELIEGKVGYDILKYGYRIPSEEKETVFRHILKKHKLSAIYKRFYYDELSTCYKVILKNKKLNSYYEKSLKELGFKDEDIRRVIIAIKNKDETALKKSIEIIESKFSKITEFKDKEFNEMVISESKVNNFLFNTEDVFLRDLFFVFPEIYIIKAIFSKSIHSFKNN